MPSYIEAANENVLAIVTIEHPQAVRNIDEIMAVEGLDLAFIGPGNLAMSLGIPGEFEHPTFVWPAEISRLGRRRSSLPRPRS